MNEKLQYETPELTELAISSFCVVEGQSPKIDNDSGTESESEI